MNVVFRVDASNHIGSGHVMRCLTLAEQIREVKDANIFFIMRDLKGNLIDIVKKQGFNVLALPNVQSSVTLQGYAAWLTVPQNVDAEQSIELVKDIGVIDLLVIDSYAIDISWEAKLRPFVKRILAIDDLANRKHDCDILLDQNLYEDMEIRYKHLVPGSCKLYLGPKFALLREEFYVAKKSMKKRKGELNNILVFFGGVDATNETSKTLKALMMLNNKELEINVVVGDANPHKEEVKQLCRYSDKWHYYCQINNMAEFMAKADIAIGAGGTTTWERCFLYLPAIVIAVAENQIEIAEACANHGFIEYLGFYREVNVNDIVGAIRKVQGGYYHMLLKACIEEGKDYGSAEIFFEKCNRK